jgi:hypothetical protein
MKKCCIFPDQTKISTEQNFKVIDFTWDQFCISYTDEESGEQILWVPNDFIVND